MCGIAAIWNRKNLPVKKDELDKMVAGLFHRGPVSNNTIIKNNIGFGHTRLMIIDPTDKANQPFTDGKDILIFNGEIFNYKKIKDELKQKTVFSTNSDTEVLFKSLQEWGKEALNKIEGQFSFIFFNHNKNSILIARDHVGICPLYVMENEDEVIVCSEIKPILEIRKSKLSLDGIVDYFNFRYNIQNERTLFNNIIRFNPAHYWEINLNKNEIIKERYWRLNFEIKNQNNFETEKKINPLLDNEIYAQTMSDVSIGMFLSGGIDSSAILKGFSKNIPNIKTFSMQFKKIDEEIERVNELNKKFSYKKNIISFKNIDQNEIEKIILSLEEPFGDLIIAANYELCKKASEQVKVILSGEGGDESFFGYDHQRLFMKLIKISNKSLLINKIIKFVLYIMPSNLLAVFNSYPGGFGNTEKKRILEVLDNINNPPLAYYKLISLFDKEEIDNLIADNFKKNKKVEPDFNSIKKLFLLDKEVWKSIMRLEIEKGTLIINLLKQDRFSMGFSLESRVPLVSKKILNFVSTLKEHKIVSKKNKYLLTNYFKEGLKKKKPFSVLNSDQYKSTMIELWEKYVTKENINKFKILNWENIDKYSKDFNSGSFLNEKKIMAVLIFVIWCKCFEKYIIRE